MAQDRNISKKQTAKYIIDDALAIVMEDAKRHDKKDLWWECLRRRCELKQQGISAKDSPLELDFYAVMFAYETLQGELRQRTNYRANRTWKLFENKGAKAVLEKWALNKQKEPAFRVIIDHDGYDLTGEYMVLKHKNDFSPEVVTAARQSLLDGGVRADILETA